MNRFPVRRGDRIIILALLGTSLLLFLSGLLPRGETVNARVVIETPDETVVYPVSEDRRIPVFCAGHTLTVVVSGGAVHVEDADCPDKICEGHAPISAVGESIVCLPAETVVRITGGEEDPYADVIVG